VQADGRILVGGYFTRIGGETHNYIARLDAATGLADSFNPNPSGSSVESIAVQADGRILAGGGFTSIGGQTRNDIARLDATTGLADSFDPNAGFFNDVFSIVVQADGKILAGGHFTTIGGQTRNNIARLDAATGLADSFDPNASSFVYAIAVQPDGKILVGGLFHGANSIGGQTRNYIARLDAATGLADSFDPNANFVVFSIAVQADAKILAGGWFTTLAPNGGTTVTRHYIARLTATQTCVPVLSENFDGVTAPALPAGWVATNPVPGNGILWVTSTITPDTLPNSAFIDDQEGISDKVLDSPPITIDSASAVLSFRNNFDLEFSGGFYWDGGVLEVSSPNINGGAFTDITNAAVGGSFISGGYIGTVADTCGNPLAGRMAWSGYSGGYINTVVNLGPTVNGQTITLRFRMGSDCVVYASGWHIDGLTVTSGPCGTPTPSPTPTPTGTATATATPTATSTATATATNTATATPTATATATPMHTATPTPTPASISISGTILYCSNPVPGPVQGVTLNLTGTASGSTPSDSSGNYQFSSLIAGGNYTVTPTKAARAPGSAGINTTDVIAVQRHFLIIGTPLTGCRLTAADANGDSAVNTVDVVAIQRFYLVLSTGTANVGNYKFTPANRSYPGLISNQTAQNYDTLVFGDVATPYVH
jgi:uncharacterized delta-60 repeat protein